MISGLIFAALAYAFWNAAKDDSPASTGFVHLIQKVFGQKVLAATWRTLAVILFCSGLVEIYQDLAN
ncbi:MAG: hypothetical protein MK135_11075 [Polyangiaceae bacterium]|nr:hypothetical protein [Polyangiaceae bacterium]